jgi:hypothetical protein
MQLELTASKLLIANSTAHSSIFRQRLIVDSGEIADRHEAGHSHFLARVTGPDPVCSSGPCSDVVIVASVIQVVPLQSKNWRVQDCNLVAVMPDVLEPTHSHCR